MSGAGGTTLQARVTPRQAAIIQAVAEAEGLVVSELVRRAVFAFVWGNLEMVDLPSTDTPALLRLHDFPRIARSLNDAHERDMDRLEGRSTSAECPDCGVVCVNKAGLSAHRRLGHKAVGQ